MKKTEKVLLLVVLLICLCFSVSVMSYFYPLPYVERALSVCRYYFPFTDYAIAGFCGFVCLCFAVLLLITLFFPNKLDYMLITKSKGRLYFSKRTLVSTVRYSFADLENICSSRVRVKIGSKPEKTKVYVKLTMNDPGLLAPTSENVQERIAAALMNSLGIEVKYITIRVTELRQSAEEEKATGTAVAEAAAAK